MNTCLRCGKAIKSSLPFCRDCLIFNWKSSKDFIKPKHNPTFLPWSMPHFRSVVTMDFITNPDLFIETLGDKGSFYFDSSHKSYCCVLNEALGVVSGSAIPANYPMPKYPLDSIFIADIINNPHVYSEDYSKILSDIKIGNLISVK